MAKSRFEYVRKFEQLDRCLPNTWIVVRIDGRGFHRFSDQHGFEKPNDLRAINLMNDCACNVLTSMNDLVLGYGQSDEYSFVFKRNTETYNRRASKLSSAIVSLFSSSYVFNWSRHFPDTPLKYLPSFDSRAVLYPTTLNLRDYLSWRQADCHINNLYNTCFWKLVLVEGLDRQGAESYLKGTVSGDKNEILFSKFGINYNDEPAILRKGTVVYKQSQDQQHKSASSSGHKKSAEAIMEHVDIIKEKFWNEHPGILVEK